MGQHTRNLKAVKITSEMLFELFKTSDPRVISCNGLPRDAKAVRIGHEASSDTVWAIFEHESFPACEPGRIPEWLYPTYTEYRGDKAVESLGHICG
jgi:hypothetical protein